MFRDWRWGIPEALWQEPPLLLELLCGQGGARPLQEHLHAGWGLDLCLRWPHIRVSFVPANGELTRLLQGMSLSAPTVPLDCQLWPPWWPGSRWSVTSPPWPRASSSVTWTTASGTLRWHYTWWQLSTLHLLSQVCQAEWDWLMPRILETLAQWLVTEDWTGPFCGDNMHCTLGNLWFLRRKFRICVILLNPLKYFENVKMFQFSSKFNICYI